MNKVKLNPSSTTKGLIDQLLGKTNELVTNANEHSATANPELSGGEDALESITIGDTDYALAGGVDVIDYTDDLGTTPYTYAEIMANYLGDTPKPLMVKNGDEIYMLGGKCGSGEIVFYMTTTPSSTNASKTMREKVIFLDSEDSAFTDYCDFVNVEANPTGNTSGTLSKIKINGTKYSVGGSLYRHSFTMTCTFSSIGTLDVFGDIITSSNEPFTALTLATYLSNNYSSYGIVGGAIDSVENEYNGSAEIFFNIDDDSLAVRYGSSQANASNIASFVDSVHAI